MVGASARLHMEDAELRAKLEPAFAQFDVDGSGSISTTELRNVVEAMGMEMSEQQVADMMKESDPDSSGAIEFEEFVTVLKKQTAHEGRPNLALVFTQASSFFGFLNPLTWFAPPESEEAPAAAPAAVPTPTTPGRMSARRRGEARSPVRVYGRGRWAAKPKQATENWTALFSDEMASPSTSTVEASPLRWASPGSGTVDAVPEPVPVIPRVKAMQWAVKLSKRQAALEVKQAKAAAKSRRGEVERQIQARRQGLREEMHSQSSTRAQRDDRQAVKRRQHAKRAKAEIQHRMQEERAEARAYALEANERVGEERRRAAEARQTRLLESTRQIEEAKSSAKKERAIRREEAQAAKDDVYQRNKAQTRRVKDETSWQV